MSAAIFDARTEVLLRLGMAHDHFVVAERRAWKAHHKAEAEDAHRAACWLVRAYAAERDNPKPADLP